jgi:Na+-driven multidrug efflux pump
MSGHEREYRQVMLITGPLSILISLILIYFYGIEGAAIATALNVGMQNLFALLMVRSRLGFWSIG